MPENHKGLSPESLLRQDPKTIDELWEILLPDKCTGCTLCEQRNQIVPNRGNGNNGIMLVAQNPGQDEDEQGIPLIGRVGKYLNILMAEAGIDHNECWLSNCCKCHSAANAKPTMQQIKACQPLLLKEIELVDPYIIVGVGSPAVSSLLGDFNLPAMKKLVGRVMYSPEIERDIVPVYHPSYLLRNGQEKTGDLRTSLIENLKLILGIAKTERISHSD